MKNLNIHTSRIKALCFLLSVVLANVACATFAPRSLVAAKEKMDNMAEITKKIEDYKLELTPRGEYNMPGFGEEFFIYYFDTPNDNIVVYYFSDSIYLLGENSGKTGASYADACIEHGQFIALSDKYFLFLTSEGKIAISFEENTFENIMDGESRYLKYSFDDLSEEEQAAFIYPTSYEKRIQFKGDMSTL